MKKANNLMKNTVLLSIGTILNKGLTFLMIPLFSRWLSTEDYGVFDLFCTYVTMLIPLVSLSIGDGVFRFAIDANDNDKKKYFTSGLVVYLIGLLITTIIILVMYFITSQTILLPFLLMLSVELINKYLQSFLRAIKKLSLYSISSVIVTVFTFLGVFLFVKVLTLDLYGIIYGYSLGFFVGNLYIVLVTRFTYYLTKDFSRKEVVEMCKYSFPLIPNSISWWIVNASDRSIINVFLGSAFNGIYAVSCKIPNLCSSIFSVFSIAWQEEAIEMSEQKDKNEYYSKVFNKMLIILISLCIGVLSLNFILFDYIFDKRYVDAHLYTSILVTSVIFSMISQFYGGIQISLKQPKANGITTIIGAISNIVINIGCIKFIGLYAAAISTLISNIIITILRHILLIKNVKIKINKGIYKYLIIYMYMCIVAYYYNRFPLCINILNLIIAVIVFLIINRDFIVKILKKIKLFEKMV